jgi:hypothetical protein
MLFITNPRIATLQAKSNNDAFRQWFRGPKVRFASPEMITTTPAQLCLACCPLGPCDRFPTCRFGHHDAPRRSTGKRSRIASIHLIPSEQNLTASPNCLIPLYVRLVRLIGMALPSPDPTTIDPSPTWSSVIPFVYCNPDTWLYRHPNPSDNVTNGWRMHW